MSWSVQFPPSATNRGYSIVDGSQTGLDPAGDFTIEFWWYYGTSGNHTQDVVVGKADTVNGFSYQVYWEDATPTQLSIEVKDAAATGNHKRTWSPTLTLGTWHYFAITFDAGAGSEATQFELFQGDESTTPTSQGNGSLASGALIASVLDADSDFGIGIAPSGGGGGPQGEDDRLFEVRFWDDIRTLSEIQTNFALRLTGSETNLQGNWLRGRSEELDSYWGVSSTTKTLTDATANANDLVGTALTTASEIPFAVFDWPVNYVDSGEITYDADEILSAPVVSSSVYGTTLDADEIIADLTVYTSPVLGVRLDADQVVLGGTGSGIGQLYRMRASDGTLARQVYWTATEIDTLGVQYTGPGPLTDVVVSEIIGD